MKLLLDTHALLWFLNGDSALSAKAKAEIGNVNNEHFISVASLWEIAIKIRLGKLDIGMSLTELEDILQRNGFTILSIKFKHIKCLANLALHHRDPFDRMLIAQAMEDDLYMVSCDAHFDAYNLTIVW